VDWQLRISLAGLARPNRSLASRGATIAEGEATDRSRASNLVIEAFQISATLRIKRGKDLHHDYQEVRIKLARIESSLVQKDPNFHR